MAQVTVTVMAMVASPCLEPTHQTEHQALGLVKLLVATLDLQQAMEVYPLVQLLPTSDPAMVAAGGSWLV